MGGREASDTLPYHLRLCDGRPFAFVGLWDRWQTPEGEPLEACTILTTTPNELVQRIHDRMPVTLPSRACNLWLDPAMRDVDPVR
jgi:putative SOS response-associated peptidase YedK